MSRKNIFDSYLFYSVKKEAVVKVVSLSIVIYLFFVMMLLLLKGSR